jgi:hypothetical protein
MKMQDVINQARLDLNDSDKVRHTDIDLLVYLNNYVQEAINNRPDLFFTSVANGLPSALGLDDDFPISDRHARGGADYIIARANMRGTEEGRLDVGGAYMQLSRTNGGI